MLSLGSVSYSGSISSLVEYIIIENSSKFDI